MIQISDNPNVLMVPAASPYKTLKDLIDYARARRGQLNFGSAAIATIGHLVSESFAQAAGTKGRAHSLQGRCPRHA